MAWYPQFTPGDPRYKQFYNTGCDRKEIQRPILEKWQSYCENGWLSENHEDMYCTENKTKWFLQSCADFLLREKGNSEGTITAYKDKRNRAHEVSLDVLLEYEPELEL